jgi:A118 family predicted phage portal protein
MSDYESYVKTAVAKLKNENVESIYVHGRNPNIETYYDVWRGVPDWLDYKYRLPKGEYKDAKLKTLNLPRYLCRTWANNYANEDTSITIPKEKANERLQEVFINNNLFGRFNNFCEMFMGLGIGATAVETDAEIDEEGNITPAKDTEIKIKMIAGRRVVPITVEDGEVTECAFFSFFTGGARMTVHYLLNDEYHIAIFTAKGNNNQYTFDFDKYTDIPTGANKNIPLFQVWQPNVTEEDEIDKCIGASIFSTAMDTFKHLDLGYTAYYKEVKLSQKIKFITTDMTVVDAKGNTVPFDEDDESVMFVPEGTDAQTKIQEVNGDLRIDALTKYINTNLNCAAMLCGLGQTQFEFDGGGGRPIQTATGVIAKQTELYRNVVKQENFATAKFRQLVMAIAHMNNNFTSKPKIDIKKKTDIVVVYDDNIVEDTTSKKQAELNEVNAGVMSIAEFRSHWYDENLEDSIQFVQENGLLLDKYTLSLQAHVITPEMFVDLVFGENYKYKNELIDYINQNQQAAQMDMSGFSDESDNQDTENEDEDDE